MHYRLLGRSQTNDEVEPLLSTQTQWKQDMLLFLSVGMTLKQLIIITLTVKTARIWMLLDSVSSKLLKIPSIFYHLREDEAFTNCQTDDIFPKGTSGYQGCWLHSFFKKIFWGSKLKMIWVTSSTNLVTPVSICRRTNQGIERLVSSSSEHWIDTVSHGELCHRPPHLCLLQPLNMYKIYQGSKSEKMFITHQSYTSIAIDAASTAERM